MTEAKRQCDLAIARLQQRIGNGEFDRPDAFLSEFRRIMDSHLPGMSESERAGFERTLLLAHQAGAELLADHGDPVPGSDPDRLN